MNIDEHPAIPGQMGIQSIPAVIAFVDGKPADGFLGALPEGQVIAFLERLTKQQIGGEDKELLKEADAALAAGNAAGAAAIYAEILAETPGQYSGPRRPRAVLSGDRGNRAGQAHARARCPRPSATRPRWRRPAPRWRWPSRPPRSARSANWKRRSRPIRSTTRRGSILPWRSTGTTDARRRSITCMAIVRRDRKWNDDGARKQLVQFFEAWGPTDEFTVAGRRSLSSILFA